jgi:hypothetical protein
MQFVNKNPAIPALIVPKFVITRIQEENKIIELRNEVQIPSHRLAEDIK